MATTAATTNCACTQPDCAWVSHASVGQRCENAFDGPTPPGAWATLVAVGLCCPSCIAIKQLRDAGPVEPIRWRKQRHSFDSAVR